MPNVTFVGEQPNNSNACGAYAVTAALHAFDNALDVAGYDVTVAAPHCGNAVHRLAVPSPMPAVDPGQPGPSAFANQVYGLTGIFTPPGGNFTAVNSAPATQAVAPHAPQVKLANTNFSTPYSLVSALLQLDPGRQATVNLTANCRTFLEGLFGVDFVAAEIALIDTLNNGQVNTGVNQYANPQAGEVQLVLVGNANAAASAMHWPVRGGNGDWYDPGDGSINNNWTLPGNIDPNLPGAMQTFGNATLNGSTYVWTGLWITVS